MYDDRMVMVFLNISIILTLLIVQLIIPNVSRKNILLGVKIPEDQIKKSEVKEIIKRYRRETGLIGGILLVISSIWAYQVPDERLFIILIFVYIFLFFLIYLRWNKKLKVLKVEKEWNKLASNTIAVDTTFSSEKGNEKVLDKRWFLIPLGIVLLNFILTLYRYPYIPDQIPHHWDFAGNPDAWMDKSILSSLFMPLNQLILTITMYICYYFMMKSKRRVDSKNPEESIRKNIKFMRIWGFYFLIFTILLVVQFTYMNFVTLEIIGNMAIFDYTTIFIAGAMVIFAIVIGVKVGQGGERLKLEEEKLDSTYDIEDDSYWKLGNTIYYNKEDPALFVEKRVGVGWTVNAGKLIGKVIIISPFVILLWVWIYL